MRKNLDLAQLPTYFVFQEWQDPEKKMCEKMKRGLIYGYLELKLDDE